MTKYVLSSTMRKLIYARHVIHYPREDAYPLQKITWWMDVHATGNRWERARFRKEWSIIYECLRFAFACYRVNYLDMSRLKTVITWNFSIPRYHADVTDRIFDVTLTDRWVYKRQERVSIIARFERSDVRSHRRGGGSRSFAGGCEWRVIFAAGYYPGQETIRASP